MNIELFLGIVGATAILFAFYMNQKNIWKNSSINYDFINFIGSVFLAISAFIGSNWPFFVLNSVWGFFAGADVVKFFLKKK